MLRTWLKNRRNQTQAKVQQNALVVYLPRAQTPTLWRMQLEDLATAQFDIAPHNPAGFVVQYKPQQSIQVQSIAIFTTLDDAQDALNKILQALFKGQKNNGSYNDDDSWLAKLDKSWPILRLIKWLIVLFVVYLVVSVFSGLLGDTTNNQASQTQAAADVAQQLATPSGVEQLQAGEAADADAVLQGLGQ